MNLPYPLPTPVSTRPLAVFDLDDTLNTLTRDVIRVMRQRYDIAVEYEDILHFDWHRTFGPNAPQLESFFCEHDLLETTSANPEGIELVHNLLKEGWDVEVWTARSWHPRGESITRQWLKAHGLDNVTPRLCDYRECKSSLIRESRVPDLYLDDAPHYVLAMAKAGTPWATLVSRPWNRGVTVPWRVHNLAEVASIGIRAAETPVETMEPV